MALTAVNYTVIAVVTAILGYYGAWQPPMTPVERRWFGIAVGAGWLLVWPFVLWRFIVALAPRLQDAEMSDVRQNASLALESDEFMAAALREVEAIAPDLDVVPRA